MCVLAITPKPTLFYRNAEIRAIHVLGVTYEMLTRYSYKGGQKVSAQYASLENGGTAIADHLLAGGGG
ncbi:hypothetical protein, partial [Neochlamydia sp. AcF84]|uniref:hypothetical protein n=1 Tax=Neochlamydia sp. AcF84 TaxID=2315858 RepID=UPI001A9551C1